MALDPMTPVEKAFIGLNIGEAIELPSPWPGFGDEPALFLCTGISAKEKTFAVSYYGIEIGPVYAEFQHAGSRLLFKESE